MKFIALAAALLVVGCSAQATGGAADSALMNGLAALKDGDAARLSAALAASEQAMAPIRAAADPCAAASYANRAIAEENDALTALAKAPAASMSEEARLLLALTHAAGGSFTGDGEIFTSCPPPPEPQGFAAFNAVMNGAIAGERARGAFLYSWMDAVRTAHGAQYDVRMKAAAAQLTRNGFEAEWPFSFHLMGGPTPPESPPGRFSDVQASAG